MSNRSAWAARLQNLGSELRRKHQTPAGQKGLGVYDSDRELWRIGGDWLAAHRVARPESPGASDVYIATNIYRSGGHSLLIGDFVRALSGKVDSARHQPKLIVTNTSGSASGVDEDSQSRTGVTAANTMVLRGPSLVDRLDQLFEALLEIKPQRLFLFHHPDDPLPVAAARPEVAPQRVLVHHADARLSFGLHLPGMQLIDLNPIAVATSRLQGLSPALLRLTCPDPGPRPIGFLRRQHLVTATSSPLAKIARPHFYGYPDTLGVVLRTTQGWHVHIGELDDPTLAAIHSALNRAEVPADRFVHVPWTPSVATTLWEHDCDVYVSSFPIDGARTNVEVMASGTPHLRFSARPASDEFADIAAAGGLAWHTWEDLEVTLRGLANREFLDERSQLIRSAYDSRHHPRVFETCLHQILEGGADATAPHQEELDWRALRSMANATASTALTLAQIAEGNSARARLVRWLLRI